MGEFNKTTLRRDDLIYADLSYRIVKVLFEVDNELGPGYQEKYYQRAVAVYLKKYGFSFREQVPVAVTCKGEVIGHYFLDFLIEDKVILEIKRGEVFRRSNIQQVYAYLKATKRQLGIIANFTKRGVIYKRIINLY